MATVMDHEQFKQCGYALGDYEFNMRMDEWNFDCRRCDYGESLKRIEDKDGNRVGWRHGTFDGHGAVWATSPGGGVSTFYGLRSAQEVETMAQKMRDGIAKGELDAAQSYVSRWDAEAKRVEVVAGSG